MEVHMRVRLIYFLLLLLVGSGSALAADVGSVKSVKGQAWIMRGQERIAVVPGTRLMVHDILNTGSDGALGLILRDDTIISMGSRSEMALAEFVFQPDQHRFALLARFLKGTFSYLSGVMAKLAPDAVRIETPVGMVAIRGTHCLIKVGQ